mgnify:CR=1 FL=1
MDNSIYWLISLRVQEKDFSVWFNDWIFETWSRATISEVSELAYTYIQNHIPYDKFTIIWIKDLRVLWQISLRQSKK